MSLAVKVWRWSATEPAASPPPDAPWYLEDPAFAAVRWVEANGPKRCRVNVRDCDGHLYTYDVQIRDQEAPLVQLVTGPGTPSV